MWWVLSTGVHRTNQPTTGASHAIIQMVHATSSTVSTCTQATQPRWREEEMSLNKYLAIGFPVEDVHLKVQCLGVLHRITYTKGGHLVLHDHSPGEQALTSIMFELSGSSQQCRCFAIREAFLQWVVSQRSVDYQVMPKVLAQAVRRHRHNIPDHRGAHRREVIARAFNHPSRYTGRYSGWWVAWHRELLIHSVGMHSGGGFPHLLSKALVRNWKDLKKFLYAYVMLPEIKQRVATSRLCGTVADDHVLASTGKNLVRTIVLGASPPLEDGSHWVTCIYKKLMSHYAETYVATGHAKLYQGIGFHNRHPTPWERYWREYRTQMGQRSYQAILKRYPETGVGPAWIITPNTME